MTPINCFEGICRQALRTQECICINDEWTGFLRAVRGGEFLMELISEYGMLDGLICGMLDDIKQIDRQTREIRKRRFLLNRRKRIPQKTDKLAIGRITKRADYVKAMLQAAHQTGAIVAVEASREQAILWGRVQKIEAQTATFACLDDCGNILKKKTVPLKTIVSVWYGSLDAEQIELCEGQVF